jgi:hypothetical protein
MWGQIAAKLDRLHQGIAETETEKAWAKVAPFFLTMAPDVGSSTNTSPNMNGKLYGDIGQERFRKAFQREGRQGARRRAKPKCQERALTVSLKLPKAIAPCRQRRSFSESSDQCGRLTSSILR